MNTQQSAAISPDELGQLRIQKATLEKKYHWTFYICLGIAALLFGMSMFMSAMVGRDPDIKDADKFALGLALAGAEIFSAVAILGLSIWIYVKKRTPIYLLMIFCLLHAIGSIIALTPYPSMLFLHLALDSVGLFLSFRSLHMLNEHEWLQQQPGYPSFSEALMGSNEYQPPAYVKQSSAMDRHKAIELFAQQGSAPQTAAPQKEAMPGVGEPLANINDGEHGRFLTPAETLASVSLPTEPMAAETVTQGAAESACLTPSADAILSDMTVPEQNTSVPGPLPDPEDVKRRLRLMKEQQAQTSDQA